MTQYADELAASSAPLHDDELVVYLLAGLDEDYNVVFTVVVARVDPISLSDLYAQLLSFKQHASLQVHGSSSSSSSTMTATRGRGSYRRGSRGNDCGYRRGHSRGHMTRGGSSYTNTRAPRNSSSPRPRCQVCLKIGQPLIIVGTASTKNMFPILGVLLLLPDLVPTLHGTQTPVLHTTLLAS
jgi:hypothetical protein